MIRVQTRDQRLAFILDSSSKNSLHVQQLNVISINRCPLLNFECNILICQMCTLGT
uniref:Uncharacterized protein n=1 Tax=Rhizophora mucronata TaxID=61149 RepID=A0A2P2IQU1_RHIMU